MNEITEDKSKLIKRVIVYFFPDNFVDLLPRLSPTTEKNRRRSI